MLTFSTKASAVHLQYISLVQEFCTISFYYLNGLDGSILWRIEMDYLSVFTLWFTLV